MNNKLRFLELSKDFIVDYDICNKCYRIDDKQSNLVCFIEESKVSYCVRGVYNSGCDYADIDVERLEKLKEFVGSLKEDKR